MFIKLYLQLIKNYLSFKKSKAYFRIFIGLIGSVSFFAFSFWFFNRIFSYLSRLEKLPFFFLLGLTERFLSLIFLTVFSMLILSSLITTILSFFYSQELQLLYTFPISKKKIFLKKAIETIIYSSYLLILIIIPAFIAYSKNFNLNIISLLLAVLSYFLFIIPPCLIGITLTVILAAYLPLKKLYQVLTAIISLAVVIIILLFRMMNPERLVNPISTLDFISLLQSISEPSIKRFPSYWLSSAITSLAQKDLVSYLKFNLYLLIFFFISLLFLGLVLILIYERSWNRSQSAITNKISTGIITKKIWKNKYIKSPSKSLLIKELLLFFRDSTQWSQLLLLIALIVVYIYNIKNIPIQLPSVQIVIAYINIALSGFVLSALGLRFVFPSISLEGQASWILYSMPISFKKYFIIKQVLYFLLLFFTSQIIIWLSNYYLGVSLKIMIISSLINFEFLIAIIGIGFGLGAIFKDYSVDNSLKLASSFGGIMFMFLSFFIIGIIILIEAYPIYLDFKEQAGFAVKDIPEWLFHLASFIIAALSYYLPQKIGLKYMEEYE